MENIFLVQSWADSWVSNFIYKNKVCCEKTKFKGRVHHSSMDDIYGA